MTMLLKMKRGSIRILSCLALLYLHLMTGNAFAQQMPQDHWHFERTWGSAGTNAGQFNFPVDVTVSPDGLIYVADRNNNRIQVFQEDGTFVRMWNGVSSVSQIAFGPDSNLYVSASGYIKVFSTNGTAIRNWSSSSCHGVAVDSNCYVYVTDGAADLVRVYNSTGMPVRTFGGPGTAPGLFSFFDCDGISIGPDSSVYVADSDNNRIQVLTTNGVFAKQWPSSYWPTDISVSKDNIAAFVGGANGSSATYFKLLDRDGQAIGSYNTGNLAGQVYHPYGVCFSPSGDLIVADSGNNRIQVFRRGCRTAGSLPRYIIPQPQVISVEQRGGVPYVDIDYVVNDPDSSNVFVAALAFVNGSNTLNHLLKINTLIEGTATNLGPNITANQQHRLTWNAAADWSTNFGNIQIEILANDGRGLLDFHFLDIPSNGPNPELKIDSYPVDQSNLLSCWYWLIATNDTAINLSSGKVYGVGGSYNGILLAQNTTTTPNGRSFLWERMGVREATSQEVIRANLGSMTGMTNRWTTRISGDPRITVNELGFSTYASWGTNAWYVVKP